MSTRTPVRFRGDAELIGQLVNVMADDEDVEVVRHSEDDGGLGIDFDLDTVSTVVGMMSTLFFKDAIVPALWQLIRKRPKTNLTIETPHRTVVIESSGTLSEDEFRAIVSSLGQ